jgi:5-methyltetrahydropteroyltriglutamate--homocysteine methyltransferase
LTSEPQNVDGLLGNRQIGVGAVDVQDPKAETGETVAARIRKYGWLAPEQTIVTSSCGFNQMAPWKTARSRV